MNIDDIEDIMLNKPLHKSNFDLKYEDIEKYKPMLLEILQIQEIDKKKYIVQIRILMRKYNFTYKFSYLFRIYIILLNQNIIKKNIILENNLKIRENKSTSGVIVLTVVLSPYPEYENEFGEIIKQKFTCQWNCYYCPNEPGQPRSYLKLEPAVQRANYNNFDPYLQVNNRLKQLEHIGHQIDKIELIVLGGTWESYPIKYREQYIRDLFYSLNVYYDLHKRNKYSLKEEQLINENSKIKVVALKLETRPDTICLESIKHLRFIGCTHIQIGVQHLSDHILKKINRQVYYSDIIRSIRYLKDLCFKIDIHIMPMLPGSTPDIDHSMFEEFLNITNYYETNNNVFKYELQNGDIQADEWKIYPCQIVPWTVIKEWYKEGKYNPYPDEELKIILKYVDKSIFPWIRLNRIIRDIPVDYIIGGTRCTNMRQIIDNESINDKVYCMDIRNREIKNRKYNETDICLVERWYNASLGQEIFISFESQDKKILYGLLRLRLSANSGMIEDNIVFPELIDCALIRQIHVYGELEKVGIQLSNKVQHRGIGTKLIKRAEEISCQYKYHKIAVIASIGTRNYYRKFGYEIIGDGEYMIKNI